MAHGADLLDDYMKNVSIYEAALNEIAIVVYTVYTLNKILCPYTLSNEQDGTKLNQNVVVNKSKKQKLS